MSGGGIEYAHMKDANQLIEGHYDRTLREAARRIEGESSYIAQELDEHEAAQLVALLEAKADRIEAARESVRRAFNGSDTTDLLKSIDYTIAMDYSPDEVAAAWESYGVEQAERSSATSSSSETTNEDTDE
jgi:hypothetical protein